ncbi:U3 small nucleolar RNA-associated protein 21 [Trichomonascus vanleenenianus]|uniref:rRNA-processing protein UTP21 n=1 Tax=Trichomonascus vanleenenianus TaxID=2268995 RepID=UPI003ECA171C
MVDATKRRKLVNGAGEEEEKTRRTGSKIFSPFRTIGLVTNQVPIAVGALGQSFTITSSVGNSFQIFDASTLHLLFVSSPQTPTPITKLHTHFHYVLASWGRSIGIFKRGKLLKAIELPQDVDGDVSPITDLLLFGEYFVCATESMVYVYKTNPKSPHEEFEEYTNYKIPTVVGKVLQIVHLPTYLNKVVVVTDACLLLFNVRTGKLIYTEDKFEHPIATVESAPALDIMAVATTNGDVHLYNLKKGKILFTMGVSERITTMSFRTDGSAQLAIGTAAGDLFFYDLNLRKRIHSVRGVHDENAGGVANVHFLNGQPIVVSNGGDNLIQELVFDPAITNSASNTSISSPPRHLRSRGGHSRPPTTISFTDEESHFILSASQDSSLWSFSLRKDAQSYEFSQRTSKAKTQKHSFREKFPVITGLSYQADKQNRWDNILTSHKNLNYARTWSGARGIVGKYKFETIDGGLVKSVCVSHCGNFGIIGSSNGGIAVYNMQSGLLRRRVSKAHSKAVTGIIVDARNTTIMSCSFDGRVAFHDFKTGKLIDTVVLDASATDMRLHGSLLAVALDNLSVVVIDTETRRVVRELWGHSNRITSFDFTPDGRWIISASLDSTVRTWDLPSGGCIDAVRVESVATGLRISPTGDWLATTHVESVGIQLWTLKSQFSGFANANRHVEEDDIVDISMPNVAGEGGANILEGAFDEAKKAEGALAYASVEQLSNKLLTFSLQPRAKFNTLQHLDVIKLRNKPTEAPKAPEKLPFFLGQYNSDDKKKQDEETGKDRLRNPSDYAAESKFTQLLRAKDLVGVIDHLKTLSPAATDVEIRSLKTLPPLEEFVTLIDGFTKRLQMRKDYELVQAWMSMLLRAHGDVILEHGGLLESSLKAWESEQQKEAERLDTLVKYCGGVLNYLRAL